MVEEVWNELLVYKVILCGISGVGKIFIFCRFWGDGFEIDILKF